MPTLMTDPRSGGVKKKSGVNVLPIVAETWAKVRDDNEPSIDWLIASYEGRSKTDITVIDSGFGGIDVCSQRLPHDKPVFGGCKLRTGRFVTFYYVDEEHTSVITRGRAAMHKNGVLNTLEGSDCEIDMRNGLIEEDVILGVVSQGGKHTNNSNHTTYETTSDKNHIHKTEYKTTYTPYTAVSKTPNEDGTGGTVVTTKVIRGGSFIHPEKTTTKHTFQTSPDEVGEETVSEDVGGTTTKTTTLKTLNTVESSPTRTTHTKTIRVMKPDSPKATEIKQQASSPPQSNQKQTVTTKTIKTPQGETTVTTTVTETTVMEYYEPAIIPYAFLKDIHDPNDLPEGVDPEYREMSLSDKEFMEVFGMDKFQWEKLPTWKKKGLRREKGLF